MPDEIGREDPHVSGKYNQIHSRLLQPVYETQVVRLAGQPGRINEFMRDGELFRDSQRSRLGLVRQHHCYPSRQPALPLCLEDVAQVLAFSRGYHP